MLVVEDVHESAILGAEVQGLGQVEGPEKPFIFEFIVHLLNIY